MAAALYVLALSGGAIAQVTVDPPQPTPRRTFDPSDVYFQGYLTARDAETLEKEGDIIGAHDKLKRAKEMFDAVRLYYPDWKPDMVKDRGAMTNESIAKIEPKANELRLKKQQIVAELEGGTKVSGQLIDPSKGAKPQATADLPKPLDSGKPKDKDKPAPVPNSAPAPLKPLPTAPIRPIQQVDPEESKQVARLEADVARLQKQLREAQAQTQQLQNQAPKDQIDFSRAMSRMRDMEIQRDQAQLELSRAQGELNAMRARLAAAPVESDYKSLETQIGKLDLERDTLNRALTQSRDQLAGEKVKTATLQADLAVLQQKHADLKRDTDRQQKTANDVVKGLMDQKKDLETLLKQRDAEIVVANKKIDTLAKQLGESQAAYAQLQTERDGLLREKEQMSALLKLNESGRIQDLIEQNMTLAKQLREAEERVKKLSEAGNEDKDLYVEALRDLAIAKHQIGRLQGERAEQDKRLKELETRLKSEQDALASGAANSEEVKTLREVIKRQLQAQNRRQQAREELMTAVKQLGEGGGAVKDAADLLGGIDVTLTPEEQKLIADSKADIALSSPHAQSRGKVSANLTQLGDGWSASDSIATKAFEAGRLLAAKEVYVQSVDDNPGNTSALCKLGFIQMKLEDYPSSAEVFQRATEIDGSNPYAHLMLGVSLLKLGDASGAEQALTRAVQLAPDDARGHLFLGSLYLRQGRTAEAESSTRAAMMADPTSPEPYYNLALFCSKSNRKEEGKRMYMKSLEFGALPDVSLEKKLGLN
ncbi:tetratricopeptide repeat protein [Luteolibacter sp. LG18]|uniref:tetratricopeptide repeat protein n=1 Tax=Luteolibacter sp. LG18 TaxID=2819286 RepID=UPI0030C7782D